MRLIISILLISISLFGCTAKKPSTKTRPNETIVFGRLLLDNNIDINNKNIKLCFFRSPQGRQEIKLDENGFFCVKMKLGTYFLGSIEYTENQTFTKILTDDCIYFNLQKSNKIHYLGDVFVSWIPSERDVIKKGFTLGIGFGGGYGGGAIGIPISKGYTPNEDCPARRVIDTEATIEQFKQKFPNNEKELVFDYMNLR